MRLRIAVCCLVLSGALAAGEYDVPGTAWNMMRTDLDERAWRAYVAKALDHFETWSRDNPTGNFKRYLDDKLLERAPGVLSGKIENLQSFIYWLALYAEYREPPPWYIRMMARKHGREFENLLADFSWEKFSAQIHGKHEDLKRQEAEAKLAAAGRAAAVNPVAAPVAAAIAAREALTTDAPKSEPSPPPAEPGESAPTAVADEERPGETRAAGSNGVIMASPALSSQR
ncbi:MAG: hypothetical protein M5U26_25010 [Planctomycetota bacterium]|nr:hypothetical protein [Planctomycetota bacterium]